MSVAEQAGGIPGEGPEGFAWELLTGSAGQPLTQGAVEELYRPPGTWLRANMAMTLDGRVSGSDGRSGSINSPADRALFAILRRLSDAVVVGAGTARTEGYRPADRPIIVVSGSGQVPERLQGAPAGAVLLATHAAAPGLRAAQAELGVDQVLVLGAERVELGSLRPALAERGLRALLCEGGPSLLGELIAAEQIDELCLTITQRIVGGSGPTLLTGAPLDVTAAPASLLRAADGTLFGRWLLRG